MDKKELQQRTKKFHVDVIKLCSDRFGRGG
jgi:hypothetical protein